MAKRWRVDWKPAGVWRTFKFVKAKADAISLALLLARGGHQVRVCDLRRAGSYAQYG